MEHVGKDELIFEQGGVARCAYALAAGSIRIVQTGGDGRQVIIRFVAQGEMFGTVPLFTDHLFPADAIAAEPSLIFLWSEADFLALIDRYPRLSVNVVRIIGACLAEAQDRIRELSTQRAERRIAHAVLRLASKAERNAEGNMAIDIPLRRKDLAEVSGTTLHTASRTLAAWQKAGLLVSHEQRLVIHDLPAIGRISEDVDR
ncbi:MAG: cyclic nucleotide-binding protein [Alphaproteobacteria bacterium HGW-Alphaproteobacteria-12]|nr:MAG: cyclic nucleotide-binding protein [Alphaproteobacteria bacterium HGW-Alphaproteobacteria-12]